MVPRLLAYLSTGLDAKLKVFDVERQTCKRTCVGHRKGILSFAAVESLAVLVSGGLDRELLVWPYIGAGGGRAIASLRGHASSVVQVVSDSEHAQVISLGADHTVRVWDLRKMQCVQLLNTKSELAAAKAAENVDGDQQRERPRRGRGDADGGGAGGEEGLLEPAEPGELPMPITAIAYDEAENVLVSHAYYGSTYYGPTYYGSAYCGSTYYGSTHSAPLLDR
jgi:WD40 repeat protein